MNICRVNSSDSIGRADKKFNVVYADKINGHSPSEFDTKKNGSLNSFLPSSTYITVYQSSTSSDTVGTYTPSEDGWLCVTQPPSGTKHRGPLGFFNTIYGGAMACITTGGSKTIPVTLGTMGYVKKGISYKYPRYTSGGAITVRFYYTQKYVGGDV